VETPENVETSVKRPPFRKVLIQLVVLAAWTVALIALDRLTRGDGLALVVSLLGYGGYLAWYFWSHRYR
jgi:hypothetical protein